MSLLSTAAKAAVASSVHGRVQRRQQNRWAAREAAAAAPVAHVPVAPAPVAPAPVAQAPVAAAPVAAAPVAQAAPPAAGGPHELMTALTALRAAGVVTDTEFADISSRIFG